jgi:hypothetical protein
MTQITLPISKNINRALRFYLLELMIEKVMFYTRKLTEIPDWFTLNRLVANFRNSEMHLN